MAINTSSVSGLLRLTRVINSRIGRCRRLRLVLPVHTDSSSPVVQHAATRRRGRSIRCGLLRFGAQFRRWHEERGGKEEYVPFSALRQLVRPSVHQAGHKDRRGAAVRAPPGARRPAPFLSAAGRCSAPTTGRLSPSYSLAHRRTEVTVGLWVAGPPAMGQAAGQRKQER